MARRQYESSVLGTQPPIFQLSVLGGVKSSGGEWRGLSLKGDIVYGKWADLPRIITTPQEVLQQFVNCNPTPQNILAFTHKYGPLTQRYAGGEKFSFTVPQWIAAQRQMRAKWFMQSDSEITKSTGWPRPTEETPRHLILSGQSLAICAGVAKLTARTLLEFFDFQLALCHPAFLKICANTEDCAHQFFIATRKTDVHCSDECKRWGKRKAKLRSYHGHKHEWASVQRKKRQT